MVSKSSNTPLVGFLDESAQLDGKLAVIADLCFCCREDATLLDGSLNRIGEAILDYLQRRAVLEQHCFGRATGYPPVSELTRRQELARLKRSDG